MSFITEVLVHGADKRDIAALNDWLRDHDPRAQQLTEISMDAAGGAKWWTSSVYAACFNHLPNEFLAMLENVDTWPNSPTVMYLVDDETYTQTGLITPDEKRRSLSVRDDW